MKIAIVGSREFKDKKLIESIVRLKFIKGDTFISGGARGVDSIAESIIDEFNKIFRVYSKNPQLIDKKIFKPDWDKYGKRAGAIRNKLIVNEADRIIAFWDGESKGTKITIDLAIKAGKPLDIYVRN